MSQDLEIKYAKWKRQEIWKAYLSEKKLALMSHMSTVEFYGGSLENFSEDGQIVSKWNPFSQEMNGAIEQEEKLQRKVSKKVEEKIKRGELKCPFYPLTNYAPLIPYMSTVEFYGGSLENFSEDGQIVSKWNPFSQEMNGAVVQTQELSVASAEEKIKKEAKTTPSTALVESSVGKEPMKSIAERPSCEKKLQEKVTVSNENVDDDEKHYEKRIQETASSNVKPTFEPPCEKERREKVTVSNENVDDDEKQSEKIHTPEPLVDTSGAGKHCYSVSFGVDTLNFFLKTESEFKKGFPNPKHKPKNNFKLRNFQKFSSKFVKVGEVLGEEVEELNKRLTPRIFQGIRVSNISCKSITNVEDIDQTKFLQQYLDLNPMELVRSCGSGVYYGGPFFGTALHVFTLKGSWLTAMLNFMIRRMQWSDEFTDDPSFDESNEEELVQAFTRTFDQQCKIGGYEIDGLMITIEPMFYVAFFNNEKSLVDNELYLPDDKKYWDLWELKKKLDVKKLPHSYITNMYYTSKDIDYAIFKTDLSDEKVLWKLRLDIKYPGLIDEDKMKKIKATYVCGFPCSLSGTNGFLVACPILCHALLTIAIRDVTFFDGLWPKLEVDNMRKMFSIVATLEGLGKMGGTITFREFMFAFWDSLEEKDSDQKDRTRGVDTKSFFNFLVHQLEERVFKPMFQIGNNLVVTEGKPEHNKWAGKLIEMWDDAQKKKSTQKVKSAVKKIASLFLNDPELFTKEMDMESKKKTVTEVVEILKKYDELSDHSHSIEKFPVDAPGHSGHSGSGVFIKFKERLFKKDTLNDLIVYGIYIESIKLPIGCKLRNYAISLSIEETIWLYYKIVYCGDGMNEIRGIEGRKWVEPFNEYIKKAKIIDKVHIIEVPYSIPEF